MISSGARWVLGAGGLVLAACGAEETPPAGGVAPPVVGDIGPAKAGTGTGTSRPRPRLTAMPRKPDAAPRASGSASATKEMPPTITEAELASFEPKVHCQMPALGTCSAYGAKYPRVDGVATFCSRLGGTIVPSCPTENLVARCLTGADVLSHYYAAGDKPHTKEAAEAKCTERKWSIVR